MGKDRVKDKDCFKKWIVKTCILLIVLFVLLTALFFLGDLFNLASVLNLEIRYDWAATFCAMMSAISSILLATVSVIQNNNADETNKRLAKINQDQLEASIIKDNYPLIKFCDLQRIEESGSLLVFRFFDTRNNPLKEIVTWRVVAIPLKDKYKNEKVRREITIREKKVREPLQFTFNHDDSQTGFYMIKMPIEKLFDGYRYCRVELEMELISTTGVVTRCKGYVLLDAESNHKGMPGREYPYAYHQFFEIREISSEQKYRQGLE